ncbi:glycoside hydrolase family 17 protein [Durotheca rogersii]|uniref:glycoside hydrolase family 17 protein n=1 Tax=Durotheca rogersii TaxID=419775 RepID=UPI0022212593|nr:glycoside hydrolase family 17 protein [Durotheca rogersii]KAI5860949.1 glycoside hydrolase family 17 protein [Durotheca rogersii]
MAGRYSSGYDPGEDAPLDNPYGPYPNHAHSSSSGRQLSPSHPPSPTSHNPFYQDHPSAPSTGSYRDHTDSSPSRVPRNHPGAHPDSAYNRLRQNRLSGVSQAPVGARAGAGAGVGAAVYAANDVASSSAPIPPIHRDSTAASAWGAPQANVTPGADNFGEIASGGMSGLAMSVAERNARESGLQAMREAEEYQQQFPQHLYADGPGDAPPPLNHPHDDPRAHGSLHSLAPPDTSALSYSDHGTPTRSMHSHISDPFGDPQLAYGQRMGLGLGQFNPNDIDDDGDDGLEYRRSARTSILSLGGSSGRGGPNAAVGAVGAAGTVAGAAAGGGVLGGLIGKSRNTAINYDPIHNTSSALQVGGAGGDYELAAKAEQPSEWLTSQKSSKKKWKWFILIVVGLLIAGGIAGGVVGGLMSNNRSDSASSNVVQSADSDTAQNGDLNINSAEIQALMNNDRLHKVFPGVDYTPIHVQFPDCLDHPASQNNITRDVAVLSQLTDTIRLYGTDCNQTEMTIHAVRQLKLQDEVKIWLGVWLDGNDTTNKRQLSKMWTILDQYGSDPFKGVIIGNELLFRKQMTAAELSDLLSTVRRNLTEHKWDLPVATSDLGDNWNSELASISDYIMGNIHPFFAGVNAKEAASWTWTFWQNKASGFFKTDQERNVVAEIGWPTKGGTNCGSDNAGVTDCPEASVAGIDELNTLMEDWVCQALENGTNYFWFEMFDEPWKISFNTPGKEWEDQWGLMDVNRNLKEGVKIPDCGGKTI